MDYYYHGIQFYPGCVGCTMELMLMILEEGLVVRWNNDYYKEEKNRHVCLYKKNDAYDYDKKNEDFYSAKDCWINNNFVFVIDEKIPARKASYGVETDLIDEWRCYGNITPSHFVGIALPFKKIEEYINSDSSENKTDRELVKEVLPQLLEVAGNMNLDVYSSDFYDDINNREPVYKKLDIH